MDYLKYIGKSSCILLILLISYACDPTYPIGIHNTSNKELLIRCTGFIVLNDSNSVNIINEVNNNYEFILKANSSLDIGMVIGNKPTINNLDIDTIIIYKDNDTIKCDTKDCIIEELVVYGDEGWGIYLK